MKNKTYYNVCRAAKMIQAKGYDQKTAFDLAKKCFDNAAENNNCMPVEWYIEKIVDREQYEHEYR